MKLYPSLLHKATSDAAEAQPMALMNTTPLIDVMLVLLVMLIITIPVQLHAVALDMPSASSQAQPKLIRVQIDANGFVRWDGELISDVATLDARLSQAAQLPEQPEIHITPEPNTPYSLVVSMMALAQKMGLRQVGVVN
ncbi:biopolymer transporter ExbD [Variovorax sp. PCZ-1]|uniref:ExbD/TolR family protein n=1 Tax=Variovorax sp. PCZ-1 TaxID=2835533 RepID=UPI001BCCD875|nr:biopolymer transporter ExbD [Variovorax sp. PCZ-1]MBS7806093.1 biopolymer transporter ExbD [Variovorax sp. PCZ-1]